MSIHEDKQILIKNEAEYPNGMLHSIHQKNQPPIQEFIKPESQENNQSRNTVQIENETRYKNLVVNLLIKSQNKG